MDKFEKSGLLIETDVLAANLENSKLRIFDCAAQPGPNPDVARRKKYPFIPQNALSIYQKGHIPNSSYIDVPNDLTNQACEVPMTLAPTDQLVDTVTRAGINDDSHVILYSSTAPIWATRVWWVLKYLGLKQVSILNGGFSKWFAEDRPVSTEASTYLRGTISPKLNEKMFVTKNQVHAAINGDALIIHALTPSIFDGSNDTFVFGGRRGHIPGSINIPSITLLDGDCETYLPREALQKIFDSSGIDKTRQIITYCGGGINATTDAFILTLLGYEDVSVYDGSMNEWGNDPLLPIEI